MEAFVTVFVAVAPVDVDSVCDRVGDCRDRDMLPVKDSLDEVGSSVMLEVIDIVTLFEPLIVPRVIVRLAVEMMLAVELRREIVLLFEPLIFVTVRLVVQVMLVVQVKLPVMLEVPVLDDVWERLPPLDVIDSDRDALRVRLGESVIVVLGLVGERLELRELLRVVLLESVIELVLDLVGERLELRELLCDIELLGEASDEECEECVRESVLVIVPEGVCVFVVESESVPVCVNVLELVSVDEGEVEWVLLVAVILDPVTECCDLVDTVTDIFDLLRVGFRRYSHVGEIPRLELALISSDSK